MSPDQITECLAMALKHQQAGHQDKAERLCLQVLKEEPANQGAVHLLGVLALQKGEVDRALELLGHAVTLAPDHAAVLLSLGLAHRQKGELEQAKICVRRTLSLEPDSPEAHNALGDLLTEEQELEAAAEAFQRALELRPDFTPAYHNLGNLYAMMGESSLAVSHYRKAEELDPDNWEVKNNLGLVLQGMGDLEAAERSLHQARLLEPTSPVLALNLAALLLQMGRFAEAEELCREPAVLMPRHPTPQLNLGLALIGQGRLPEAQLALIKAASLAPDNPMPHTVLGTTLRLEGKLERALAQQDKALALEPDLPRAQYERASILLLQGSYAQGWPGLEARRLLASPDAQSPYPLPAWDGADLRDHTVMLWSDGGLSRVLLLARLVPELRQRGAVTALLCPPVVQQLLAHAGLADLLVAPGHYPEQATLQAPLEALPRHLGLVEADQVPPPPYLTVTDELVEKWSARLAGEPGLRICFMWKGEEDTGDPLQAVPLEEVARLFEIPGTRWTSLQYGASDEEAALLRRHQVPDLTGELEDLAHTLACLQGADLFITPDTALAHLAGAAGLSPWVLLPTAPAWWWGLERRSPWYPEARLFRRRTYGPWTEVLDQVKAALEALVARI